MLVKQYASLLTFVYLFKWNFSLSLFKKSEGGEQENMWIGISGAARKRLNRFRDVPAFPTSKLQR